MEEILSFQEMKSRYSDEWLLVVYTEIDEDMRVVRGKVLAHSPNRDEIYRALLFVKGKSVAIEYTGVIPEDLAVVL